jgi:hypothetical protein
MYQDGAETAFLLATSRLCRVRSIQRQIYASRVAFWRSHHMQVRSLTRPVLHGQRRTIRLSQLLRGEVSLLLLFSSAQRDWKGTLLRVFQMSFDINGTKRAGGVSNMHRKRDSRLQTLQQVCRRVSLVQTKILPDVHGQRTRSFLQADSNVSKLSFTDKEH